MLLKHLATPVVVATGILAMAGLAGLVDAAESATADRAAAKVTVTITAEGTDLSGVVKSAKPQKCAANRTVTVFKQKGTRGGGDDQNFASDTTSLHNGHYEWSTGNTGTEGRFYAVVKAKTGCKAASSATIRAVRNP